MDKEASQGIRYVESEVISGVDNSVAQAEVLECTVCDTQVFCIFIVQGQDHAHIQCLNCGTSYCFGEEPCNGPV